MVALGAAVCSGVEVVSCRLTVSGLPAARSRSFMAFANIGISRLHTTGLARYITPSLTSLPPSLLNEAIVELYRSMLGFEAV